MKYIDTHTHLYLPEFDHDREAVVARTLGNSVQKVILPNIDSNTITPLLEMCQHYPANCFPAIGLHPSSVTSNFKEELEKIRPFASHPTTVAIGEIGIDLYWDKTFLEEQKEAFAIQLQWAKELDLPVIIHSRDSHKEVIEVLHSVSNSPWKGIFHCFGGTTEQAKEAINLGFFIGIGGVITFKNSTLGEVVKEIGIAHLVVETDAPYLAPVPYRGKRNESSYIPLIAEKIASFCNISIQEVSKVTTNNTTILFNFNS